MGLSPRGGKRPILLAMMSSGSVAGRRQVLYEPKVERFVRACHEADKLIRRPLSVYQNPDTRGYP